MTFEQWLMTGISLLTWIFALMGMTKAKKIEEKCDGESNAAVIILYIAGASTLVIVEASAINITIAITLALGGILCALIPSGFNSEYVYLRGVRTAYRDIKDMKITYRGDRAQLSLSENKKKYRALFATGKDISKLNKCMTYWRRGK